MIIVKFDSLHLNKTLGTLIRIFPELAAESLYTASLAVLVPEIKENIKRKRAIFEGQLFQRVDARAFIESNQAVVYVGAIGVPWGKAVEFGQKPGKTQNLSKLIRYARLKLGAPAVKAPFIGKKLKAQIEAKGSKAKPFLIPAFEDKKETLTRSFAIRLQNAIKKRMSP